MKFNVNCSWANHCANEEGEIEADNYESLFEKLKEFFDEACGFSGVESFDVYPVEDSVQSEYYWSNEDLPRSKNLSNVWRSVQNEIKEEIGDVFI